ncbi:unnamed protein product [Trichobilharzia regenti]|nr:unnamed protein product [Trichobilharzia regenti]
MVGSLQRTLEPTTTCNPLQKIPTTTRTQLQVDTNPPTKAEVLNAFKLLKAGKAAGADGIFPEALKADP